MHNVRILGLVLHCFYSKREKGFITPKLGDCGHCLSFEDIFPACEQLSQHGLLEWKVIWGGGSASFGAGRITPEGIEIMEGRRPSPLPMLLPHPAANVRCGATVLPEIAHHLDGIAHALSACKAGSAEVEEIRRRLSQLAEYPLMATMSGNGGP